MQSKTSFCNSALLKKSTQRFWPLWLSYLLVQLLALPSALTTVLRAFVETHSLPAEAEALLQLAQRYVMGLSCIPSVLINYFMAILAAMAMFGYLYSSRSASFMASIPVKRGEMFCTQLLGGFLPVLAANLAVFLLTLSVQLGYGCTEASSAVQWLLLNTFYYLAFYGMAVLCAQLTGTLLILPCIYVIASFIAILMDLLIKCLFSIFFYGYCTNASFGFLWWLSPPVTLCMQIRAVVPGPDLPLVLSGIPIAGIYALAGIVCILLAAVLYQRRRMESAADVVAVNVLKPVFKYCMTFSWALVFAIGLYSFLIMNSGIDASPTLWVIFFGLIGAVLGYFAAEMLIRKSLRVFHGRKVWRGLGISAVVFTLAILSCSFDFTGFERRVPNAEDVQSVRVLTGSETVNLAETENIRDVLALHQSIVENPQGRKSREAAAREGSDYSYSYIELTYTLKSGAQLRRSYTICQDSSDQGIAHTAQDILNCPEAILFRKQTAMEITAGNILGGSVELRLPDSTGDGAAATSSDLEDTADMENLQSFSFTPEELAELYNECILPDMQDGTIGRVWIVMDDSYYNTVTNCQINIDLGIKNTLGDYDYDYFYTVPTVDSKRTNEWLMEHGVQLSTMADIINMG